MARFVRKIGQGTVRYLFELQVHEVVMHVPYEVQVGIVFKNSSKRQETRSAPTISKECHVADFSGEKLTMLSSIGRNKESG